MSLLNGCKELLRFLINKSLIFDKNRESIIFFMKSSSGFLSDTSHCWCSTELTKNPFRLWFLTVQLSKNTQYNWLSSLWRPVNLLLLMLCMTTSLLLVKRLKGIQNNVPRAFCKYRIPCKIEIFHLTHEPKQFFLQNYCWARNGKNDDWLDIY